MRKPAFTSLLAGGLVSINVEILLYLLSAVQQTQHPLSVPSPAPETNNLSG